MFNVRTNYVETLFNALRLLVEKISLNPKTSQKEVLSFYYTYLIPKRGILGDISNENIGHVIIIHWYILKQSNIKLFHHFHCKMKAGN